MPSYRSLGIAAACLLLCGPERAPAHTVSLDGSPSDWFAAPAPSADLGRVARRAGGGGEYVWRDAVGDARQAWPARAHDLVELRVTGDRDNLYVMARLDGPVATSGDSVPQLQIAIDTDRLPYSGGTAFTDSAGFEIVGTAAYELLLETRFGSGSPPRLLDGQGNRRTGRATAVISAAGVIEVSLPWSDLSYEFVPGSPLRIGAALFLSRANDVVLDPHDATAGRAADVMTRYGGVAGAGTTAQELVDDVLHYACDLWFDSRGEVVAPLVVNESYCGDGTDSPWLEFTNPTQAVVSLSYFKVARRDAPDGSDAIAQFPAGTLILPGHAYVVARDGAGYFTANGKRADAECVPSDPSTPDMSLSPAWVLPSGQELPDSGDEVLVLDGANTVVDVLTFNDASWPGVVAHPGAPAAHSLERLNPAADTDDCDTDFADQPVPNPGLVVVVAGVPGAAASGSLAWAPPAPNPARGGVALTLRLARAGMVRVEVLDAAGRRTRTLFRGEAASGELHLRWDGLDESGHAVPPGAYFVRAESRGGARSVRLAVIR
jgi:hypothetical protein